MSADLRTQRDHPAALLQAEADRLSRPEVHRGTITHPGEWSRAADLLRQHEAMHQVTFAALDNDTLARVREAYEHPHETSAFRAGDDLADAVRDLLGLDD